MKTFQITAAARAITNNTAIAALVEVHPLRSEVYRINHTLMMGNDEIFRKAYQFLWNESHKGTRGLKHTPWSVTVKTDAGKMVLTDAFGKIKLIQIRGDVRHVFSGSTLEDFYDAIEYFLKEDSKVESVETLAAKE